MTKKILFLTGTRADYGKLKPLMESVRDDDRFECRVFVTGMHTLERYGQTVNEVRLGGFSDLHVYVNQIAGEPMDIVLANTIHGLARYMHESPPDLIVVHGDRLEALAGAVVGAFRNIRTAHVEGGELSGTIDGMLRHSISKLAHLHFVANDEAARRLLQLGELRSTIHVIGSPDIDVMLSDALPDIDAVHARYEISSKSYGVAIFHPVTSEPDRAQANAGHFVSALLASHLDFVVIYPNNDAGSDVIFNAYERLNGNSRFRLLPSMRFEYFLSLLKHARCIVGNSSAGVREAPVYGVPSVDVGTRQRDRFEHVSIQKVADDCASILKGIEGADAKGRQDPCQHFGRGNSREAFMRVLSGREMWEQPIQKRFMDLDRSLLTPCLAAAAAS